MDNLGKGGSMNKRGIILLVLIFIIGLSVGYVLGTTPSQQEKEVATSMQSYVSSLQKAYQDCQTQNKLIKSDLQSQNSDWK